MNTDTNFEYLFLPHHRKGVAEYITGTELIGPRAVIETCITVSKNGENTNDICQNITLCGPPDAGSINFKREIRRTDPDSRHPINDYEPNYLPLIEFASPDLPWRYTPVAASDGDDVQGQRLYPWLTLLVLKENEFFNPVGKGPGIYQVNDDVTLPDLSESWAWAHVQITDTLGRNITSSDENGDDIWSIISDNPEQVCSRLISPRRLEPATHYYAFLVATFKTGRKAALGEDFSPIPGHELAWVPNEKDILVRPYFQFDFRTGDKGDFESLVRLLRPAALAGQIGVRDVYMGDPGPFVDGVVTADTADKANSVVQVPGALIGNETNLETIQATRFKSSLTNLLERKISDSSPADGKQRDPTFVPPTYGSSYMKKHRLNQGKEDGWPEQANLDPRYRIISSLGCQIVQKNQKDILHEAWRQAGDLELAADSLRHAQLGQYVSLRIDEKYIPQDSTNNYLSLTSRLHNRVIGANGSVAAEISKNVAVRSLMSPGFTKLSGPIYEKRFREIEGDNARIKHRALVNRANTKQWTIPFGPMGGVAAFGVTEASREAFGGPIGRSGDVNESVMGQAGVAFVSLDLGNGVTVELDDADDVEELAGTLGRLFEPVAVNHPLGEQQPALDLASLKAAVKDALEPTATIAAQALAGFTFRDGFKPAPERLDRILDYPELPFPVSELLIEYSKDMLMPGIEQVENNTVNMVCTNPDFIAAFLLGANHSTGTMLLFNRYPTDLQGTYLSRFWDRIGNQSDINEIHTWDRRENLGSQNLSGNEANPVLLVRGEVFRKYPNTIVYASVSDSEPVSCRPATPEKLFFPIFEGLIPPDVRFFGFDAEISQCIEKDGVFFTFESPLSEARFGMDVSSDMAFPSDWNDLAWSQLPNDTSILKTNSPDNGALSAGKSNPKFSESDVNKFIWAQDSAHVAAILAQQPVRMRVHSANLINKEKSVCEN